MFFLLSMMKFPVEIISGIVAGVLYKAYFATRMKSKIKDFQNQIIKSEERIIQLEALNEQLEKRLKEMEDCFSRDSINMN